MDSLYIVMPAYNEEANIETTIKQWYPLIADKAESSRLVVADSGSSDRTHFLLEKLQAAYPKLEILSDTGRFHGPKVMALYKYAIEKKADYIFQTDSDGQTDPAEFSAFWEERDGYDALIGNRNVRGDGADRAFVEKVVCLLVFLIFGVRVPDANAPFRLMKGSLVAKYIDRLPADYELPNIMMTVYFAFYKEKLKFNVISFKPRQGGKNSLNIPRIVGIGIKAIKDFAALKKAMH